MAEADKPRKTENQQMLQLQRFMLNERVYEEEEEEEEEEIELSLGLSLNGIFGVDPRAKNKLTRSSSIPDFIIKSTGESGRGFMVPLVSNNSYLVRTCSLPTEADEEWRKRKDIQMLRRMETKRKRSEKQKNLRALKDRNRGSVEDCCEEDKRQNGTLNHQQDQFLKNFNGLFRAAADAVLPKPPPSQGSIGSQGSGSSGISESDTPPVQGTGKCNEAVSPVSVQSLSECERKLMTTSKSKMNTIAMENSRCNEVSNGGKDTVRNIMEEMPCVSTKGDGPNGKRIEGFLYRYRKGEEVRIVCVCHGSFLSPAEFVKHAGGGDVAHPLKHIVVNPYPIL